MIRSSALAPWHFEPLPGSPRLARQCLRCTSAERLSTPASATTITLPPSPPSPPSGPPRGTYFSRRKLTQPSPPLPASTSTVTLSTNMGERVRVERSRGQDEDKSGNKKGMPLGASLCGSWSKCRSAFSCPTGSR